MIEKNIQNLINYSEEGIISRIIFKDERKQATLFCMAAGTDISEHATSKEGYVYVIEGKGIFNLETKPILMEPGKLIGLNKNVNHFLSAEENTSFLLFLFG